jgi:RNA polymerase sigma factor (sigma-70 family)
VEVVEVVAAEDAAERASQTAAHKKTDSVLLAPFRASEGSNPRISSKQNRLAGAIETGERPMPSIWDPPASSFRSNFSTTHWSMVLAASTASDGEARAAEARAAMEQLCRVYWPPIYSFVRREGRSAADAEQLTQEFFTRMLERRDIDKADPERGRFRNWLLAMLKNYLTNHRKWEYAQRRDKRKEVWMDALEAEESYRLEPRDNSNPEKEYQRDCAVAVVQHAFRSLREECDARGRGWLFDQVQQTLLLGPDENGYLALGHAVGEPPGNLKTTIARWRKRWVELIREQLLASLDVAPDPDGPTPTAPPRTRSQILQVELDTLLLALTPNRAS